MAVRWRHVFVMAAIIAVAAGMRFVSLSKRPLHADEADQAFIFKDLLENGRYVYYPPPRDIHGPTLHYLALPLIALSGDRELSTVSEAQLRTVTAVTGLLAVLCILLLFDGLGRTGTAAAMAAAAIAPSTVFFSRYFIHQMPLFLFTLLSIGAVWRCLQTGSPARRIAWALLAGAAIGLMHATKETCIIAFFSGTVSLVLVRLIGRRETRGIGASATGNETGEQGRCLCVFVPLAAGITAAVLVSASFFSSFGQNGKGIGDSLTAYVSYVHRGAGHTECALSHVRPWYFYLKTLLWRDGAPWISAESLILLWATAGFVMTFSRRRHPVPAPGLVRFCYICSLVMLLVYSAIPYKTPWCVLQPLAGLLPAAGAGVAALLSICGTSVKRRATGIAAACLSVALLCAQSAYDNCERYEDPRNPYVYVHTSSEMFKLIDRFEETVSVIPASKETITIQVISPHGYSPLQWYLRKYTHTGYYTDRIPKWPLADIILFPPSMEKQIIRAVCSGPKYEMYIPLEEEVMLRPGVFLTGCMKYKLVTEATKARFRARNP